MSERVASNLVLRFFFLSALASMWGAGCSHYYLPASRLETPEARGRGSWGRAELAAVQMGTNLNSPAVWTVPEVDPETGVADGVPVAVAKVSPANFAFGYSLPVGENMDVGVRLQPFAPLQFRFKWQFAGEPEQRSRPGNLSAALQVAPGVLVGQGASIIMGDVAVSAGYRLWANHLFSMAPFVTIATLSGMQLPAAAPSSVGAGAVPTTASVTQYGAMLGYQYSLEGLFLRTEAGYLLGNFSESSIRTWMAGFMVGLLL